ncbi:MAG: hypothetical protein AB7F09_10465 [Parvibaculaceae bacterium]
MKDKDFQNIRKPDPRRAYGPGETPAELAELILPGLDKLIAAGKDIDELCHDQPDTTT